MAADGIAESEYWWYWPQIPWELTENFRPSIRDYPDEYEELWNSFGGITQDGGNVTAESINDDIEAYAPDGPYVGEGFLRSDDIVVWTFVHTFDASGRSKMLDEPSGLDRVQAKLVGYMTWQSYRLALAMQGSKLTQFGRRGLRPG